MSSKQVVLITGASTGFGRLFTETLARRVDVAINNAGYYLSGLEEAVTTEQARQLMDTNFLGVVRVNRAVLPHMRRQRSGVLIHISSGAGRVIHPATLPPHVRK